MCGQMVRPGVTSLLKDGSRAFSGLDEAVLRNIEACINLCEITETSYGPRSMNKLIVNHIGKHFITSDVNTIVEELEIQHPAVKMIVMACKRQSEEYGDGTNTVLILCGELLKNAAKLLTINGLHPMDIIKGYEMALEKVTKFMESLVCFKIENFKDKNEIYKSVFPIVTTKHHGYNELLSDLISEACADVMPDNTERIRDFQVDNVRIVKLLGGSPMQSFTLSGMIINKEPSGTVRSINHQCNVMVLGCGLEMTGTEAKGTVVLKNADELLNFTRDEEQLMENLIKDIKVSGNVDVIITGGPISDIAQHFCNKYNILTLRIMSKWELRRVCRSLGAIAMVRLGIPLPEELGRSKSINVQEIGSKKVTIINALNKKVTSIVLRGSTQSLLDEMERCVLNAVSCVKSSTKDNRFIPGGGATAIEISRRLRLTNIDNENNIKLSHISLEGYAIEKYAESLEVFPRLLAQNTGLSPTDILASLYSIHQNETNSKIGINLLHSSGTSPLMDCLNNKENCIMIDHLQTIVSAFKLATDAATTILSIDEIIMAKPAGGPKPPSSTNNNDED
ncbi:TCP-1 CPN60 chaperonin family protein [Cryptosporidium andersoni]|uniref:CCT-theta n=1 Tax=Cryptosporidium andersoni TaxID=117008 RepID=A0A1J4MT14_9CRYT|nr:TCP-1 CPN60 chaperonin family protein [Cryptosporidium andersoni]